MYDAIYPGQVWLDTNGNPIQAHGGSIFYEDRVFYWYGENKEHTRPDNGIWHWGVRCYRSTDLYNWEDMGCIIPPEPDVPESPLHPSSQMDRPHIIYNQRTGKYVAWLKIMHGNKQNETVMTADRFLGPYTVAHAGFQPLDMDAGDLDLVVAPDGKAYYYFERCHSELICADLTSDYTDVTGYYSTHFPYGTPPMVREAPAYFTRGGKHYLFTSGTTGYHPNPSRVAVADSYHGPWVDLGDPHVGDSSCTSFNSQISSVFKVPGKKDLYIALADRWIPDLPEQCEGRFETGEQYRMTAERYRAMFDPTHPRPDFSAMTEEERRAFFEEIRKDRKPNPEDFNVVKTAQATYVWLPVTFDPSGKPALEWRDSWRIEEFE